MSFLAFSCTFVVANDDEKSFQQHSLLGDVVRVVHPVTAAHVVSLRHERCAICARGVCVALSSQGDTQKPVERLPRQVAQGVAASGAQILPLLLRLCGRDGEVCHHEPRGDCPPHGIYRCRACQRTGEARPLGGAHAGTLRQLGMGHLHTPLLHAAQCGLRTHLPPAGKRGHGPTVPHFPRPTGKQEHCHDRNAAMAHTL